MINLFEPYAIRGLPLRNRFVRSATWDATADSSGAVTDRSLALIRNLAHGGVGLIVTGHAFVSPLGQASSGQFGVHTNDMFPGLKRTAHVAHQGGAKIALQITHGGINSNYLSQKGTAVLAVSKVPEIDRPHRELREEEIEAVIEDFASAAVRAREAGFDAVQLHGAHGYLMSQFLSPLFNTRSDKWGGSPQNRRRFHLEVIRRARQRVGPDFPLLIKFGVRDDRDSGLSLSDGIETARLIAETGIDAIEISGGVGTPSDVTREGDPERAYFRERARAVKRAVSVPVMVVGGIRSLPMAHDIVESGDADLISMSRPFIREPGLIRRWENGDGKQAKCITCSKCFGIIRSGELLGCWQERYSSERRAQSVSTP